MTFNASNGFQLERAGGGAVLLRIESPDGDSCDTWVDAETWISCMAAVSPDGGTSESYELAKRLHWGDLEDGENPRYGPGNPDWERDRERDDA